MNPHRTTRRGFLGTLAALGPCLALDPRLLLRPTRGREEPVLVILRLGGGNDGLNAFPPVDDPLYRRARPTLALGPGECVRASDGLFFHPSLEPLRPLYEDGRLAVVESVGLPQPNRSHFESMDIWHTGRIDPADRGEGWVARALRGTDARGGVSAAAVTAEELPLALVGRDLVAPVVPDLETLAPPPGRLTAELRAVAEAEGKDGSIGALRRTLATALSTAERVERARRDQIAAYPPTALGRRLATVRALLEADIGLRVIYTALDGFDTHSRQAEVHAGLLSEWALALAAFQRDLDRTSLGRRVVTFAFSEFGRRVAENGSRGTDHGAGGPVVLSGPVRGGRHGRPPDLEDLVDGDVRPAVDFRRVLAELLDRVLGRDPVPILGGRHDALGVLEL